MSNTVLTQTNQKIEEGMATLRTRLDSLRTGRVTPNLLDAVRVPYQGSFTPLYTLASIAVDGRALLIRAFDPADGAAITEAIHKSPLGLTVQAAKTVLRVPIPHLSGDRRAELAKAAKVIAEEQRVAFRNVRRGALKDLAKLNLPKDEAKKQEARVEDAIKVSMAQVDEALASKLAEMEE